MNGIASTGESMESRGEVTGQQEVLWVQSDSVQTAIAGASHHRQVGAKTRPLYVEHGFMYSGTSGLAEWQLAGWC